MQQAVMISVISLVFKIYTYLPRNLHLLVRIPKVLSIAIRVEEWALLNFRLATASEEFPVVSERGYGVITLCDKGYAESK